MVQFLLNVVVFVSGAVLMSLEIVGSRVLAPLLRQLDFCLGKPDLCRSGRIERRLLLGRVAFSPRTFLFPASDIAGDSGRSDFSALYLPDC